MFKIFRSIISIILENKQSHKISYIKRIATNFSLNDELKKYKQLLLHEERK